VKVKLELESISVLIDTAIPCGQIIIELMSNSLKHAFANSGDGEIFIHLS
jgi:two-component sensor histidine kinase